jgi:hypothetical protein
MTPSDEDHIAYLAGEDGHELTAAERVPLDELRALLASDAMWADPDPSLEQRVVAAVAQDAQAESRPAAPRARPRARLRSRRPRRSLYLLGGLAAAAAAAAVIAIAASTSSGPAAQQFAMVVSGTPLAPGAAGSATLTKTDSGWRIELSARGLPHLANGRYYEAWLRSSAGILVPVGTFNDARHVTLWAGVPPTQFPVLTVTEQQANGNPASSGRRVLTGTIRTHS